MKVKFSSGESKKASRAVNLIHFYSFYYIFFLTVS